MKFIHNLFLIASIIFRFQIRDVEQYMFKLSIDMVKTRSMRSVGSSVASSSVSDVSSVPAEFEFTRSELTEIPVQRSIPAFFGRYNVSLKKALFSFGMFGFRLLKTIPTVLGVFGGFYSLYQIYLTNIVPQNEKMEIVVLRRSFS